MTNYNLDCINSISESILTGNDRFFLIDDKIGIEYDYEEFYCPTFPIDDLKKFISGIKKLNYVSKIRESM